MEDFNSAAQVQDVMSYGDYWDSTLDSHYGPNVDNSDSIVNRVANFFTGQGSKAREAYDAYLKQNERAYEQAKINDARAYELYLGSTQYQRAVKDMQAAGLNPYLLVNGNGLNGSVVRSSASSARSSDLEGSYKGHKQDNNGSKAVAGIVGTALKLLAVLAA